MDKQSRIREDLHDEGSSHTADDFFCRDPRQTTTTSTNPTSWQPTYTHTHIYFWWQATTRCPKSDAHASVSVVLLRAQHSALSTWYKQQDRRPCCRPPPSVIGSPRLPLDPPCCHCAIWEKRYGGVMWCLCFQDKAPLRKMLRGLVLLIRR